MLAEATLLAALVEAAVEASCPVVEVTCLAPGTAFLQVAASDAPTVATLTVVDVATYPEVLEATNVADLPARYAFARYHWD